MTRCSIVQRLFMTCHCIIKRWIKSCHCIIKRWIKSCHCIIKRWIKSCHCIIQWQVISMIFKNNLPAVLYTSQLKLANVYQGTIWNCFLRKKKHEDCPYNDKLPAVTEVNCNSLLYLQRQVMTQLCAILHSGKSLMSLHNTAQCLSTAISQILKRDLERLTLSLKE